MKKPDTNQILASDTPEHKINGAITDLIRIKSLVANHTTLSNNQSNILEAITEESVKLNIALKLLQQGTDQNNATQN